MWAWAQSAVPGVPATHTCTAWHLMQCASVSTTLTRPLMHTPHLLPSFIKAGKNLPGKIYDSLTEEGGEVSGAWHKEPETEKKGGGWRRGSHA